MTSATTARNCGSPAVSFDDDTITCSVGLVPKPAWSRIRAAVPLSPAPDSDGFSSLVPAMPPITTAASTNATQAAIAFHGLRALQLPIVPVNPSSIHRQWLLHRNKRAALDGPSVTSDAAAPRRGESGVFEVRRTAPAGAVVQARQGGVRLRDELRDDPSARWRRLAASAAAWPASIGSRSVAFWRAASRRRSAISAAWAPQPSVPASASTSGVDEPVADPARRATRDRVGDDGAVRSACGERRGGRRRRSPPRRVPRKRVPSETPAAPSASAAAMPRPSMMPPDATTGTSRPTASTTCGTRASVPTSGSAAHGFAVGEDAAVPARFGALRDDPSAPAATARRASATELTIASSGTPAGCAGAVDQRRRVLERRDDGAPAATLASSSSIGVPAGGGGGGSGGRPSSARNGASTASDALAVARRPRCAARAGR